MNSSQTIKRIASGAIVAAAAAGAYVLACGPFLSDLRTVATVYPAHPEQYGRGRVGVVRPHFARRYLLQAYRRFSGQPPLANVVPPAPVSNDTPVMTAREMWEREREAVLGAAARTGDAAAAPILTHRRVGNYQSIENCLDGGFLSAVATLKARAARHGASSPVTREWIKAQDAVFYNCAGDPFVAPVNAAPSADALVRADRAYQIAAAHFYATHYDEAIERFRAVAADAASPWRPYGRYMAARALIRQGTVPEKRQAAPLLAAEAELRRVLEDPAASTLHASARGLIDFIAVRVRPAERLRELSAVLTRDPTVANQQLVDYERLMDGFVGDTTTYAYAEVPERAAIARSADLNDWVLAMQGTGAEGASRALAKWKETRSLPWLAAALWRVPASHADSAALLEAAARVDPSSPAFATLSFLRVRQLAAAGRRDEARAVLATLPSKPADGVDPETLNLLAAERFMLADSMEELLASAPRAMLPEEVSSWQGRPIGTGAARQPVFDNDAGEVFSKSMPLARLVEAATSRTLPDRLRLRVAGAGFARAWLLKRDGDALALAPVLRSLSPSVGADVERFEAASTPEARRIAGLRLLLRTPGIRANVKGLEDDEDYSHPELQRQFDHMLRRVWWCGIERDGYERERTDSELTEVLYGGKEVPAPAFLTAAEKADVQREHAAILALGAAPTYLAREAVKWAQAAPADADAAEALAHAVEGTRWGCTDGQSSAASRAAFQALHRLSPRSEWARKTKVLVLNAVVDVAQIRKAYGALVAVDDVSFDVREGEIFGLIGPNGAGKTTTMECVEGVRRPDRGRIRVLGLDPVKDVYKLQERVGVQLQEAQLQKRIKVREAVHLWASLYRRPVDGDRLLDQLGLAEKRNAWFMTLSGGQKQRLFIALALINDPELVFLDELTTGLDPQARRAIWTLVRGIRERGKTVFLTTHLMEEAERLCDRVAIIDHGRIIDIDAPDRLIARHCPERTVVVTTDDAGADAQFAAMRGVESIARRGQQLAIRGLGSDFVTAVIRGLSEHQIHVTDFRTEHPGLEDVFLKLTGHSMRE